MVLSMVRGPVILAGIGALVILATMYISYNKIIESIGLAALDSIILL